MNSIQYAKEVQHSNVRLQRSEGECRVYIQRISQLSGSNAGTCCTEMHTSSTQKDGSDIAERLTHLKMKIDKLKKSIHAATPSTVDKSMNTIKEIIQDTNKELTELQRHVYSLLMALKKVEKNLEMEISYILKLNNRPQSACNIIMSNEQKKPHHVQQTSSLSTSNVHPSVNAFNEFLHQWGGREGGWDASDHHIFLNTCRKYENVKDEGDLSIKLMAALPGIDEGEIERHICWHKKYLELQEQKHLAILSWKAKKQESKSMSNLHPMGSVDNKTADYRKRREDEKQKGSSYCRERERDDETHAKCKQLFGTVTTSNKVNKLQNKDRDAIAEPKTQAWCGETKRTEIDSLSAGPVTDRARLYQTTESCRAKLGTPLHPTESQPPMTATHLPRRQVPWWRKQLHTV